MAKEIFSYNIDRNKNAYLNWRIDPNNYAHDMYVLGNSFADAAMILMKDVLENNFDKKADSIIMPILYSVDQSIELYIKAIIRQLEVLEGKKPTNQTNHDIETLKNQMVTALKKHMRNTKGLEKTLKPVTEYITELYEKILRVDEKNRREVNIDFARYPIDTAGNPHFYVADKDNVVVDVENLLKRYSEVKDSLTGIFYMLEDEYENKEE